MAITNYTELKAAVTDWMDRQDLSGNAADFVSLAEARLNRELISVGTTATLATVAGDATVDISGLSVIRPLSLFILDVGNEYELTPRALGTFTVGSENAMPRIWAIEGDEIKFDAPADNVYPLRFVYEGTFALSDSAPTNELLTKSPDIYLAASIVWGALYTRGDADVSRFEGILEPFIAQQKNIVAQKKRGTLTVDPALASIGRSDLGIPV
jgi:hypothetical protein